MKRSTKIAGLLFVIIVAAPLLATAVYVFVGPRWVGPTYMLEDEAEEGCWKISYVFLPRLLLGFGRKVTDPVKVGAPDWSEITVLRTRDQSQLTPFPEVLPEGPPIPHGQTGRVDLGDVACTGRISQLWIYTPREPPTPFERLQRTLDPSPWDPPIAAAAISCFEDGRDTCSGSGWEM